MSQQDISWTEETSLPAAFRSHARLPFDDLVPGSATVDTLSKMNGSLPATLIDYASATRSINQPRRIYNKFPPLSPLDSPVRFSSLASRSFNYIFRDFEEEEEEEGTLVNKSWIFFFFACSPTTFPRKNKHESRKIHCRFYYLLLLLFLAFPSRLPPFPPAQRCFSTSWILLSSLFFSGARRGSFLFQLPWFNYSSREETVRNFTSLRSLRASTSFSTPACL